MSLLASAPVTRPRHTLRVWLAAGALIAAAAVATLFAISADHDATLTPKTAASITASDIRYDGGPDEGTRGASSGVATRDGVRYDGGPEEGSRGISTLVSTPEGVRYDGGPEEGTRGLGR